MRRFGIACLAVIAGLLVSAVTQTSTASALSFVRHDFASETPGARPSSVAIGDFGSSAIRGVAVVFDNRCGGCGVYLNLTRNRFFQEESSMFLGGWSPRRLALGDFNGDGTLDFAATDASSRCVSIVMTSGDGEHSWGFASPADYPTGRGPSSVAVGDFNGDGILDLAVANARDDTAGVLLGNGDGSFQPAVAYAAGANPQAVAVGDFNGDHLLDLAVADDCDPGGISVLLGNGDGTFQPAVHCRTAKGPVSLAVGDFNGDGKLDLAMVANPHTCVNGSRGRVGSVSVLLGNGDGAFSTAGRATDGGGPVAVTVGDLDGDGHLDVAVADCLTNTVTVWSGDGRGSFRARSRYPVGKGPDAIAVGDLNKDGKPDVVTANHTACSISLLLNATVKPRITSVLPTTSRVGTTVTIRGSGFHRVRDGSRVVFGGRVARNYLRWDATKIEVVVPTVPGGRNALKVVTSDGRSNVVYITVR